MINWEIPTTLEGNTVRLIPLTLDHKEELLIAAADGKLWELWHTSVPDQRTITQYLKTALNHQQERQSLPFAVQYKSDNTIIGTTRYCNIDAVSNRLEIGYTWYAKSYQRTGVNTECKYLLLKNAFEVYRTIAVEFRTNWFNFMSRNAILRLGAKQDGVLRNHKIDKMGNLRDTVVFSILQSEWERVKYALEFEMQKHLF